MTSRPALGPLIAVAFDKALGIMASRWALLLALLVVSTTAGFYSLRWAVIPPEIFLIYWFYAVYASARRIDDVAYRMHFGAAMALLGTYFAVALLMGLGLLALVVPGIWVGTSYSLSTTIAVFEDKYPDAAMRRSWALTRHALLPTLFFNSVAWLTVIVVAVASYFLMVAALVIFAPGLPNMAGWSATGADSGVEGAISCGVFSSCVIAVAYALQAQAIAQRYWYTWLVARAGQSSNPV